MTVFAHKLLCRTALLAALTLGFSSCNSHRSPQASQPAERKITESKEEKTVAPRKIYPLSVIHGGAYSAEELNRSRRLDSVVKAHYADFGKNVVVQKNPKDLFMYVSYRKSDKIYWTSNKRRIPQGEALLSDGQNLARTRCGNRLSFTPQQPSLPDKEISEDALNTPEAPKATVPFDLPVLPPIVADLYIPDDPVTSKETSASPIMASAAPGNSGKALAEAPVFGSGFPGAAMGYPLSANRLSTTRNLLAAGNPVTGIAGSSSENKIVGGGISVLVITPEPTVIGLLIAGMLFLYLFLRRKSVSL